MVGEVVSDERVKAVVLTGDVCGGDDDELSVAGSLSALGGAFEQVVGCVGQKSGGDEKDRGVVGRRPLPDLVGGPWCPPMNLRTRVRSSSSGMFELASVLTNR